MSTGTKPVQDIPAIVFPNPFEDVFAVELGTQSYREVRVELYTLTGQLVYTKAFQAGEKVEVDLAGHESGVYVGRAITDGVNRVFRVVKE